MPVRFGVYLVNTLSSLFQGLLVAMVLQYPAVTGVMCVCACMSTCVLWAEDRLLFYSSQ